MNERITENILRQSILQSTNNFEVEEQKSKDPRINKLLKNASKSGSGAGKPEFIIRSKNEPELLIVVECKGDTAKHQSQNLDRYKDYAVDGALLYSSYLSKEFDVISLGVSGQNKKELRVDGYLQLKSNSEAKHFTNQLLSLSDLQEKYIYDDLTKHQRYEELLEYNKELNLQLHEKKIQEDKRSLLISGILIALESTAFRESFTKHETAEELAKSLVSTISNQLVKSGIKRSKVDTLEGAYNFIERNKSISSDKKFLVNLIQEVDERINSFVKTYKYYDIFGEFYIEFLRYANNDKGLGIVLTPKHITELFTDLAYVDKDSVVLDNCCGTGGFLISAMREMIKKSGHNTKLEKRIKESQIIGIEYQDTIFTLASSNMIIHGDGKSNIYNEDCFYEGEEGEPSLIENIRKEFKPNVGLLNPPYKVKKSDTQELEFVLNILDGLEKNGLCVALLPIQCAIAKAGKRRKLKKCILEKHTLEAVMTLPHDIFHNSDAGVVTCAMVIRAHQPHKEDYETYFGYWKNDGFIKHKTKGRIDSGNWEEIKKEWLSSYRNRKAKMNLSVLQTVTAKDEWCAEAYMETDYSKLKRDDFIDQIHDFSVFQFKNRYSSGVNDRSITNKNLDYDVSEWKYFDYGGDKGIFQMVGGYYNKKPLSRESGEIPFIGASSMNYGITSWHDRDLLDKIFDPNWICVTNNGSVGYAYYLDREFTCSHDVNLLRPLGTELNQYIAMFLCSVIELEKFRWDYGRKWRPTRMKDSKIKLPVDDEGKPNWEFMEEYIKSLPYSKNLESISFDEALENNTDNGQDISIAAEPEF